jgi:hypothetical protein
MHHQNQRTTAIHQTLKRFGNGETLSEIVNFRITKVLSDIFGCSLNYMRVKTPGEAAMVAGICPPAGG